LSYSAPLMLQWMHWSSTRLHGAVQQTQRGFDRFPVCSDDSTKAAHHNLCIDIPMLFNVEGLPAYD
jgi:hypothetical protein